MNIWNSNKHPNIEIKMKFTWESQFKCLLTWGGKAWKSYQKYLTGNFALPQYDDEVMAGAKPFASFPAGNIQSSTFPDNEQSQIRSPAADLTYG